MHKFFKKYIKFLKNNDQNNRKSAIVKIENISRQS